MRHVIAIGISAALSVAFVVPPAAADCSNGGCIPGGSDPATDCLAEFIGPQLVLNHPPFDPEAPEPATERWCFDGDAGCDTDGQTNGVCVFAVDVCIAATDPALPSCQAGRVDRVKVRAKKAKAKELAAAAKALVPASQTSCTSGGKVTVKLKKSKRGFKERAAVVKVLAKGPSGKDKNALALRCLPREWPLHGYDQANTNANPFERKLTPAKVAKLKLKWDFSSVTNDAGTSRPVGAVTSTPTMAHGFLYVTSWDGFLYALDPKTGDVQWSFDTGTGGGPLPGVQSSATVTADGRIIIADTFTRVRCVNAFTGKPLWSTNLTDRPLLEDHIWASAQVANGRVIIGVSALLDDPATPGRLVALDLDTGKVLWDISMVPERVCTTDTGTVCAVDGDCPAGGECVEGLGGAVTATVALDETGDQIYMNTVGSFTFPSIGDSDSMMRVDAATGNVVWRNRVTVGEQFGICDGDGSIECGTDAMCGTSGPCVTKSFYHDFGFLNGPLLIADGSGRNLVVSGSKDGSLYSFDRETGDIVWRTEILPVPVSPGFAAWGLFNGAIGYADGRIHAAMYGHLREETEPANHMAAWNIDGGGMLWEHDIGASWGDVGIGGGVVFTGTQAGTQVFAYDAATGERLRTFEMRENVAGGAAIVNGSVYIPYGVFDNGGVQAWSLK